MKSSDDRIEKRGDFVYAVFATDGRVLDRARTKLEVPADDEKGLKEAAKKLFESAKLGRAPEAEWLKEAEALAERVGRPWYETPERTLVEALAEREGLSAVGIPVTRIACGAIVNVITMPQVTIRPKRLVLDVPGDEGALSCLLVDAFYIGKNAQFLNADPMCASLFSPKAFPVPLRCDTCQVSQQLRLVLTNTSAACIEVTGAFLGKSLDVESYASRYYMG